MVKTYFMKKYHCKERHDELYVEIIIMYLIHNKEKYCTEIYFFNL
jgi:hypothetical protein